ncbi:D-xylose transport system permease protein [Rhizobium sp. BK077]|uniref:sugar ABC transporter permease n=1 Tax=unclassified Rhizobium TaxID=2613769 RepID=UPI001622D30F|nr:MULTISPECIES: ABC transporter permease [unclassified Rhizobium]MBB3302459.1 D-xylose transport system permease protein [Rhizobium sp. BK112]MBB3372132.1 D-xylose transport system permease protein [Rhizobium sp. BK077]MBB4183284.1 D-xylose transport system permease protein [Rhizobium sp. BK109]
MASITTTTAPKRRTFGELLNSDLRALPVVIALVALWIFFSTQSDIFLTPRNLSNLLQQSTVVGVMALGLMFVLLVKEIDLSIAAIHGVTSVLSAKLIVDYGFSPWLALPAAVVIGAAIGSCSARWVNWIGVPSFVVTLGLGLALNGIQLLLLPATARYGLMGTGVEYIAQTTIQGFGAWITWLICVTLLAALVLSGVGRRRRAGLEVSLLHRVVLPIVGAGVLGAIVVVVLNASQGIPLPVLMFVALLAIGGYVLNETQFGLYLYAVGNNDEAARRAGIKVPLIRMAAFAIAGGVAAIAGIVASSRTLGVGVFSGGGVGGGTLLLESIAAAVIGGVSLFGGRGAIHAALLGALVIGTVQNGLNLMGVENEVRLIVTGLLLVLAVSIDKIIEKLTGQQSF